MGKRILIIAVIWLSLGFVTYGWSFAYYQGKYPSLAERSYKKDMAFCMIAGFIGGPFSLAGYSANVLMRGDIPWEYGFKIK